MSFDVELLQEDQAYVQSTKPSARLAAASVVTAVAASVTVWLTPFGVHVGGYVLGALVTSVLVVLFRDRDLVQRGRPEAYIPSPALHRLARLALIAGIGAGAWHAFWVATELAK